MSNGTIRSEHIEGDSNYKDTPVILSLSTAVKDESVRNIEHSGEDTPMLFDTAKVPFIRDILQPEMSEYTGVRNKKWSEISGSHSNDFAPLYISQKETITEWIDNETLEMIRDTIRDIYRGVRSVSIGRTPDAEVPGGEKICFEIDLIGKDAHIIEDERTFHKTLIQKVPREERQFLRFTYHVS